MPKRMIFDRWLFFAVGALALFGLFMVRTDHRKISEALESAASY